MCWLSSTTFIQYPYVGNPPLPFLTPARFLHYKKYNRCLNENETWSDWENTLSKAYPYYVCFQASNNIFLWKKKSFHCFKLKINHGMKVCFEGSTYSIRDNLYVEKHNYILYSAWTLHMRQSLNVHILMIGAKESWKL